MNYPVKLPFLKCHSGDPVKCSQACLANLQRFYLQRVGRADRRRFVLVPELLLRLAPEFVLSAFGPAVTLPDLVGAVLDFLVGRLGHHVTSSIPLPRRVILQSRATGAVGLLGY